MNPSHILDQLLIKHYGPQYLFDINKIGTKMPNVELNFINTNDDHPEWGKPILLANILLDQAYVFAPTAVLDHNGWHELGYNDKPLARPDFWAYLPGTFQP